MTILLIAIVLLVLASFGLILGAIASVTPARSSATSRGRRNAHRRTARNRR